MINVEFFTSTVNSCSSAIFLFCLCQYNKINNILDLVNVATVYKFFYLINQSDFRSRSTSITSLRSTYASSDAYSQDVLIYREDIAPETPPTEIHTLEDKENIFSEKLKKHKSKRNRRTSVDSKMAPTATKLPGRQTNNSLSSITGQIVIQPPTAGASTPTISKKEKKKVKAAV